MFPIIESEITTTPPITIIEKNEETATTATTTTAKTTTEAESPLFSIPSPTTTIDTLLTDHIRPEKEGEDEDKQVLEKEDEEEPLVDCRAEDGGCSNAGVCSAPYSSDKSVEARRITESVMTTLMNKNNNSRHRFDGEDEQTAQSTNLSSVIFRCQCPEGTVVWRFFHIKNI
jgi:hypothetical protein